MPQYLNFAGRDTEVLDGNLGADAPADLTSVLIIGTAESGPVERVISVADPVACKNAFGLDGTLIQGMYEALDAGAPLVRLYRIGGAAASLTGIGNAITVETKYREEGIEELYKLSWYDSVLYVWSVTNEDAGVLVYEADMSGDVPVVAVDLSRVYVTKDGTASTTDAFGTGTYASGTTMKELVVAGATTPGTTYTDSAPGGAAWDYTLVTSTNGIDMTKKELYEELYKAYLVLEDENLHFIHPMGVYLDDFNVADIQGVSGGDDPTTYFGTSDYLGYVKVTEDANGDPVFTWADTAVDDDYHEVNFAYQLANFCYQMSFNELMVHGTIDVRPPDSLAPLDINTWVGKAPTYDLINTTEITANGAGLLGNKFMAGKTDWTPGFYATEDENLDSVDIKVDRNNIEVDIGRHVSVFGQWVQLTNRYSIAINPRQLSYVTGGAATYAGFIAALAPDQAPSYKIMPDYIKVPYAVSKSKLNSLAGEHYVVLRPTAKGLRVADGWTAARSSSDYRRFHTFNIIKYCDREIRNILDEFVGVGMNLVKRESLKSRLESRFAELTSIVQRYSFTVSATRAQAASGELYVFADIVPAFETRRIHLVIAVKKQ